jgi:hypothetical protein
MPTLIELVNRTLSELGRPTVAAIDESQDATQTAAKLIELAPELYLEANWSFLVKFVFDNTPLTFNFSPDYNYTYQLPGDFGRFFKWQYTGSQWPIYEFADGYLLAQVLPVGYYYIVNQAMPEVYTPVFARALVLYAAAKLSPTLTNNVDLTKYLEGEYMRILGKAITQDDMLNPHFSTAYNDFDRLNFV